MSCNLDIAGQKSTCLVSRQKCAGWPTLAHTGEVKAGRMRRTCWDLGQGTEGQEQIGQALEHMGISEGEGQAL